MFLNHTPHSRRRCLGWAAPTLRTILVVPFVLQIFAAVGLVGYLSFRNSQQAVNHLAHQLIREASLRVDQHLDTYLESSYQIAAIWQQWQPHLIWMDMRMPVLNGIEATQYIKAQANGNSPKIIALTASSLVAPFL
jgi:CheY-like chemotaxis protein